MRGFQWTEDKPTDWKPWVITILARKLKDDCDGAATLGKYLFDQGGRPASLFLLKGPDGNHMVAVTDDSNFMVSNANVVKLHDVIGPYQEPYQKVLGYHNGKYTSIQKW